MAIKTVTHQEIDNDSYALWNTFVDFMVEEKYDKMNQIQKIAYLCFWYDAEVQNGGHLQYFFNRGLSLMVETLEALRTLGATIQSRIFEKASIQFSNGDRQPIRSLEEYSKVALEGEFDQFDNEYYECLPSTQDLLEKYFEENQKQFVIVV
ncbi:MAG: hypothetical protein CVU89_06485 [Firmicutes bacterium HGW-Firmicutes-14]|nr:MAG: hypothetical protein CVU89_06485 [Firmicutes bacterium HGW-Firmicutes-14]